MTQRLAAAVALLVSLGYLGLALQLPAGTRAQPGPGLFPLLVGIALVMTAAVHGLGVTLAPPPPAASVSTGARRRVLAVLGAFVGFGLLLPRVGYLAAALVFVAAALRQLGASWRLALLVAALAATASHLVFVLVLDVPLPRGTWLD